MRPLIFVVAGLLTPPAAAFAQSAAEVIKQQGASPIASQITFPAPKDLVYRLAWGVNVGPAQADSVVPGFRWPANFLYIGDANGVRRVPQRVVDPTVGACHNAARGQAEHASGVVVGRPA